MRTYQCQCDNVVFFDNSKCVACGRELGYCPACRNMATLLPQDNGHFQCGNPECGAELAKCLNYAQQNACNRCVTVAADAAQQADFCDSCRFNATIPNLNVSGNWQKWYRLEAAKRRLFYDLSLLGLPYGTTDDGVEPAMAGDAS